MTNPQNYKDIVLYFKENNYFGYDFKYIHFFEQQTLPSIDFNGKILMQDKSSIQLSPDGNARFYNAILTSECKNILKDENIEWLNVFSIDNVLQRIADTIFIGATIESNCNCGAKIVKKVDPAERVGLICYQNNKPKVIEYYELPDHFMDMKDANGNLTFNYGVTLNYLFKVSKLDEIKDKPLPIHIAKKKIQHLNHEGNIVNPIEVNAYKFEYLITDLIELMDTCLPFEIIREKEFAPVKNKIGVDSLETAQRQLIQNGYIL